MSGLSISSGSSWSPHNSRSLTDRSQMALEILQSPYQRGRDPPASRLVWSAIPDGALQLNAGAEFGALQKAADGPATICFRHMQSRTGPHPRICRQARLGWHLGSIEPTKTPRSLY